MSFPQKVDEVTTNNYNDILVYFKNRNRPVGGEDINIVAGGQGCDSPAGQNCTQSVFWICVAYCLGEAAEMDPPLVIRFGVIPQV